MVEELETNIVKAKSLLLVIDNNINNPEGASLDEDISNVISAAIDQLNNALTISKEI